jgi:sugar O-acyltransferase (sialic acid O-acetyltransferase NeuD family)
MSLDAAGRKVVIFGTGDFARIAAVYLDVDSPHEVVAFTVNQAYLRDGDTLLDREIVAWETLGERFPPQDYALFVAIGFSNVNQARAGIYHEARERGYELISYVNSRADVWTEVEIGDNTFIFEENVIQPFVRIGSNVVLWSGNHVGHDSTIEDHCFIASHAVISGNVTIGEYSFVGVNATFRDGVTVGPRSVIGAGALIMKDTEEGAVHAVRGTEAIGRKSWEINL